MCWTETFVFNSYSFHVQPQFGLSAFTSATIQRQSFFCSYFYSWKPQYIKIYLEYSETCLCWPPLVTFRAVQLIQVANLRKRMDPKYVSVNVIRHLNTYRVQQEERTRIREGVPYVKLYRKTYIQSWTVSEIMASEVWNFDSCYTLTDYQIHIETGRNMWFL